MTKIQIRKVNGVPMGREITDKGVMWGTFSGEYLEDYKDAAYPAPGCEEGEAEGELIKQYLDPVFNTWDDELSPLYDEPDVKTRQIWIVSTLSTSEQASLDRGLEEARLIKEGKLKALTLEDVFSDGPEKVEVKEPSSFKASKEDMIKLHQQVDFTNRSMFINSLSTVFSLDKDEQEAFLWILTMFDKKRVIPPEMTFTENIQLIGENPECNWPEDYDHENGHYQCKCHQCGKTFFGHKRRISCKKCSPPTH